MVVKVSMCDESTSRRSAQKVLKKYGLGGVAKKSSSTSPDSGSYSRLKRIVPAISEKENISKLDVVLEAINYIQMLQGNLSRSPAPTVTAN